MKLRLTGATFDASAQTITHASFSDVTLAGIQLITNVTDQIIIYNFADTTKGGTLSTDTLTLEYDTTSMSDTDELMILVEDGTSTQAVSGTVTANLSATDNAVLDAIAASVDTIDSVDFATQTTLAAIKAKTDNIPAQGQALADASVPVVLTAAQITTLTPPAAITGFGTAANQTTIIGHVDGIETLIGTTNSTLTTIDGRVDGIEGLLTTIDSDTSTLAATDFATEAKQDDIITAIGAIPGGGGVQYTEGDTDATITGTAALVEGAANALAVMTQPLTDTQLRAADVKITLDSETVAVTNAGITTIAGAVSGTEMQVDVLTMPTTAVTGTFWQATQPVSATDLDIRPLVNTDVVTAELSAVDNAVLDTIAAKDFATQTTLAAMNAKMVTGTDIGDVTINNASGASAVNIQDGGNTITVDGTVAVSGTVAVTQSGTWDEVGINDSGNSITVDYATTGSGTATGALRVELPTNGTGVIATVGAVTAITNALPAGTNAIGKLAANSGVDIGDVDVTSISAGTNLIADVGIQPRTTLGFDTFMASGSDGSSILVATAQAVKAAAGKVYGYYIYNPESAVTFVHFYNTAQGSVTVGTTNPLFTLPIPAGSAANLMSDIGITFGTAITIAATTTAGGNTAPATGASATIFYK